MSNLAQVLEGTTREFGDRTAIIHAGSRMTYRELNAAANRVANLLVGRGIRPGDKVALSCPNTPYFSLVYYGILKAGATVVPLNVLLKPNEIAYHLVDSDSRAYFAFCGDAALPLGDQARAAFEQVDSCTELFLMGGTDGSAADGGEDLDSLLATVAAEFSAAERSDDDTAVILYTSGTTGQPKGAELRHRNMRDNALVGKELFRADAQRPDVYLCTLPLFHSFGQTVVQNAGFAFGGTLVMMPRFHAGDALSLMKQHRVSFFAGVPTMYWGLLDVASGTPDADSLAEHLRVAASGGASLPTEIHRRFEQRFGVKILEGYGLSETSPVASFSPYGEEPRVGSIGVPIPGVEMKLIRDDWSEVSGGPEEVGEIAIKGHNVMKGYYKRPEATAEVMRDGWFRTGDLATRDADGYYRIVDRSKDLIIRGGFNVYPREVEEVLLTHPAVVMAAVIGVDHPSHGEEVKAVVVRAEGDPTTEAELVDWVKERIAVYKYPRIVEFVEALPMTSTGKILKRALR
ncbi:long-chain-fatty-acid--CoA ligase [Sphaerimonospora mesophila]|uniref:long-chain-fatty-acid--CoA ligase n=1 Tax=Sphaerimonospora mesophila TaxID=37483 RepID=UPI0006E290D6